MKRKYSDSTCTKDACKMIINSSGSRTRVRRDVIATEWGHKRPCHKQTKRKGAGKVAQQIISFAVSQKSRVQVTAPT